MFTSSDISEGWDDTFNGQKSATGSYIYVVGGRDERGPVGLKGSFVLIR
jgi:hypothetical protein